MGGKGNIGRGIKHSNPGESWGKNTVLVGLELKISQLQKELGSFQVRVRGGGGRKKVPMPDLGDEVGGRHTGMTKN